MWMRLLHISLSIQRGKGINIMDGGLDIMDGPYIMWTTGMYINKWIPKFNPKITSLLKFHSNMGASSPSSSTLLEWKNSLMY
jgi:hypothetical protein